MILGITTCYAQYDPSFSHYFDMEPSFNPGAVGKQAKINVNIDYALGMAGFEHNPRTMYAGADLPFYALKNYHGVGVQFIRSWLCNMLSRNGFLRVCSVPVFKLVS